MFNGRNMEANVAPVVTNMASATPSMSTLVHLDCRDVHRGIADSSDRENNSQSQRVLRVPRGAIGQSTNHANKSG